MFIITKHAEKRCKQRGIKKEHVLLQKWAGALSAGTGWAGFLGPTWDSFKTLLEP